MSSGIVCKKHCWLNKLITREDKNHVHKILGGLCLLSFIYRYLYVLPTQGHLDMNNRLGAMTMLIHILLSTSSLLFRVLKKRILDRPTIIYEEYRLHAIIFSLRCATVWLMGNWGSPLPRSLIILPHHLIADWITKNFGTLGVTAVRSKNIDTLLDKYIKRFYSFYQIAALGTHLISNPFSKDLGYNALIAIQSSAFLMTLNRKGLIKQETHAGFYSVAILLSLGYMIKTVDDPIIWLSIIIVYCLRLFLNCNKYILWIGFVYSLEIINRFYK